jgi:hypothetical protein
MVNWRKGIRQAHSKVKEGEREFDKLIPRLRKEKGNSTSSFQGQGRKKEKINKKTGSNN